MGMFILSATESGTQSTLGAFADAVLARNGTGEQAPATPAAGGSVKSAPAMPVRTM